MPLCARFLSTAAAAALSADAAAGVVNFLIARCGLCAAEAIKATRSPRFASEHSVSKMSAAVEYLRSVGLGGGGLRKLVVWYPTTLISDIDTTLRPKIDALREFGFLDGEIADIIAVNPTVLRYSEVLPKLEFLRRFIPDKADIIKALRSDPILVNCNLSNSLVPNAALLEERGIPARSIGKALINMPRLLTRRTDYFKTLIARAESLGFVPSSSMFLYALHAFSKMNGETFQGKVDAMKIWWSEKEFYSAFLKTPYITTLSGKTLSAKMEFLVKEARLEPGFVAAHPLLLTHSVEKRLAPRARVLHLLRDQGVLHSNHNRGVFVLFHYPESMFLKKFVIPNLQKVPALKELYLKWLTL